MYYGISGLGQAELDPTKSTISWWCWDHKGFKDCHAKQWEAARDHCQATNSAGYTSMEVCQNKETDLRAKLNCDCPSSPPQKGLGLPENSGAYILGFAIVALVGVVIWRDRTASGKRGLI